MSSKSAASSSSFLQKVRKLITSPGLYFRDYFLKRYPLERRYVAPRAMLEPVVFSLPVDANFTTPRGALEAIRKPFTSGFYCGSSCIDVDQAALPGLIALFSAFSSTGQRVLYRSGNKFLPLGVDPVNETRVLIRRKRFDLVSVSTDGVLLDIMDLRLWRATDGGYVTGDSDTPVRQAGLPLPDCPTDFSVPNPIDAVFTWVDGNDDRWREMLSQHRALDQIDFDRYAASDELKYAIRSVRMNAPWIRRIFILSNCSAPSWFRQTKTAIWIDHAEIGDRSHLPLFNSHSIEAMLPLIPDLSEHFIYLNDDFFILAPTTPTDFFTFDGKVIPKFEPYGRTPEFASREHNEEWQSAAHNGAKLILEKFGYLPTRLHQHVPYSLRKSIFLELEKAFPREMEYTKASRFRTHDDLSTASFLFHHYANATGRAFPQTARQFLVKGSNYKSFAKRVAEGEQFDFFCLNDGAQSHADVEYQKFKPKFLSTLFPFATDSENR